MKPIIHFRLKKYFALEQSNNYNYCEYKRLFLRRTTSIVLAEFFFPLSLKKIKIILIIY